MLSAPITADALINWQDLTITYDCQIYTLNQQTESVMTTWPPQVLDALLTIVLTGLSKSPTGDHTTEIPRFSQIPAKTPLAKIAKKWQIPFTALGVSRVWSGNYGFFKGQLKKRVGNSDEEIGLSTILSVATTYSSVAQITDSAESAFKFLPTRTATTKIHWVKDLIPYTTNSKLLQKLLIILNVITGIGAAIAMAGMGRQGLNSAFHMEKHEASNIALDCLTAAILQANFINYFGQMVALSGLLFPDKTDNSDIHLQEIMIRLSHLFNQQFKEIHQAQRTCIDSPTTEPWKPMTQRIIDFLERGNICIHDTGSGNLMLSLLSKLTDIAVAKCTETAVKTVSMTDMTITVHPPRPLPIKKVTLAVVPLLALCAQFPYYIGAKEFFKTVGLHNTYINSPLSAFCVSALLGMNINLPVRLAKVLGTSTKLNPLHTTITLGAHANNSTTDENPVTKTEIGVALAGGIAGALSGTYFAIDDQKDIPKAIQWSNWPMVSIVGLMLVVTKVASVLNTLLRKKESAHLEVKILESQTLRLVNLWEQANELNTKLTKKLKPPIDLPETLKQWTELHTISATNSTRLIVLLKQAINEFEGNIQQGKLQLSHISASPARIPLLTDSVDIPIGVDSMDAYGQIRRLLDPQALPIAGSTMTSPPGAAESKHTPSDSFLHDDLPLTEAQLIDHQTIWLEYSNKYEQIQSIKAALSKSSITITDEITHTPPNSLNLGEETPQHGNSARIPLLSLPAHLPTQKNLETLNTQLSGVNKSLAALETLKRFVDANTPFLSRCQYHWKYCASKALSTFLRNTEETISTENYHHWISFFENAPKWFNQTSYHFGASSIAADVVFQSSAVGQPPTITTLSHRLNHACTLKTLHQRYETAHREAHAFGITLTDRPDFSQITETTLFTTDLAPLKTRVSAVEAAIKTAKTTASYCTHGAAKLSLAFQKLGCCRPINPVTALTASP